MENKTSAASEGVPERIWVHQGNVYRINPDHGGMDVTPVEYVRASVDEAARRAAEKIDAILAHSNDYPNLPDIPTLAEIISNELSASGRRSKRNENVVWP